MIIGPETEVIAKAGSSVAKGIKAALTRPPSKWPNAHEALMELYIIVDDWCKAAAESNNAADAALNARLNLMQPPTQGVVKQMAEPILQTRQSNIFYGYVERP